MYTLDQYCLPLNFLRVSRYEWVNLCAKAKILRASIQLNEMHAVTTITTDSDNTRIVDK